MNEGDREFDQEIAWNDVGVKKMGLAVTNEGLKNHEGLGGSIKLGVMKLEVSKSGAMKSGATWHHLPN